MFSDHFHNFVSILIVSQTIIDMINEMPEYYIRRDVFDIRTCEYFCEANGVTFFPEIPLKYQKAYVRGLFDGDGGLSFTGGNDVAVDFTSHYYQIVEQFQSYIDEHISKEQHNKIATNSSKSRCVWRGRLQVLKILDWLYEDATVFLKRKYDKYLWIKSTL